jgi:hypothetical protein
MKKCKSDLTHTSIKIRKSYLLKSVINSLYFITLSDLFQRKTVHSREGGVFLQNLIFGKNNSALTLIRAAGGIYDFWNFEQV